MTKIYGTADIGALIRAKRVELGMTHSQLADVCGNSTRFISELERGKPTMQIEKVLGVLHILGFDILVAGRGEG